MREQHAVDVAVGDSTWFLEHMTEAVVESHRGIGERRAGQKRAHEHVGTSRQVVAGSIAPRQRLGGIAARPLLARLLETGLRVDADSASNSVRSRLNAGSGGKGGRAGPTSTPDHRRSAFGVTLALVTVTLRGASSGLVGNPVDRRHLRSGVRRWNRDHRYKRLVGRNAGARRPSGPRAPRGQGRRPWPDQFEPSSAEPDYRID